MKNIIITISLFTLILLGAACDKTEPTKAPEIIITEGGAEMVKLPGGWFEMGIENKKSDKSPSSKIWVGAFLMDRYEVTQEQYSSLILGNPSHFKGDKNPVEQISWAHAALYCNARSRAEGLEPCYDEQSAECNLQANGYRLPTEAEWEYACRADTNTAYFFGKQKRKLGNYAWYSENSFEKTYPVGQKKPNPWGLYDMYGNVAEWCNDVYVDSLQESGEEEYVLRGGSWNSSADSCRSTYRTGADPGFQDACFSRDDVGFRCVRNADTNASIPNNKSSMLDSRFPMLGKRFSMMGIEGLSSSENKETGIVYNSIFLQHDTGLGHPERPQRLKAIAENLGLLDENSASSLQKIPFVPAPLEWINTVHDFEYIRRVRQSCRDGVEYLDSADTPISEKSYEVAVSAVGGVLSAIDAVMSGKVKNAFCAIRPPGHHALKDRAMGFCIFNNVAIGARYIQKKYSLSKVLIVDWDVHHGNGTQDIFYDDPTVLYFSTHQYPFYPGTGSKGENGKGKGAGYNINVPLSAGSGDKEHIRAFKEVLKPAAIKFSPDFILISAGFDAHKDDLLGGLKVTSKGFSKMTGIIKEIAQKCCEGRIVSILEGGYELKGLADSVAAHISILQG